MDFGSVYSCVSQVDEYAQCNPILFVLAASVPFCSLLRCRGLPQSRLRFLASTGEPHNRNTIMCANSNRSKNIKPTICI